MAIIAMLAAARRGQVAQPTTAPTSQPAATKISSRLKNDLKDMSLEQLLNVEVTTVSRRQSTLAQSPAAIFVITQDDIHRTGATSIPEALRLAPGMEVAQVDSSTWAISARGFNGTAANKLLVQMDGRSLYTPLFSGVFWDVQDTMMEDIDRIEVIRGPAGALWGANAVNGIVNIITKSAEDTQGLLVTGGGGTQERGFAGVRYGWKLNDDAYARVYVKHFERGETLFPNGNGARDDWDMTQTGFRIDTQPSTADHFTIQGDVYAGDRFASSFVSGLADDTDLSGGNLLGRWTHSLGNGGDLSLQMYFDNTHRDIPNVFRENRDTADIDFQHHIPIGTHQDFTWGLAYRASYDKIGNTASLAFIPDHQTLQWYSIFAQDEIQLIKDRLRLTVGAKIEHNDFTGVEVQPNARLLWMIDKRQSLWTAVSRACARPPNWKKICRSIPRPPVPFLCVETATLNRKTSSPTNWVIESNRRNGSRWTLPPSTTSTIACAAPNGPCRRSLVLAINWMATPTASRSHPPFSWPSGGPSERPTLTCKCNCTPIDTAPIPRHWPPPATIPGTRPTCVLPWICRAQFASTYLADSSTGFATRTSPATSRWTRAWVGRRQNNWSWRLSDKISWTNSIPNLAPAPPATKYRVASTLN